MEKGGGGMNRSPPPFIDYECMDSRKLETFTYETQVIFTQATYARNSHHVDLYTHRAIGSLETRKYASILVVIGLSYRSYVLLTVVFYS